MKTFFVVLAGVSIMLQGCGDDLLLNVMRSHGAPGALNTKGDIRVIASTCMSDFDKCESVERVDKPTDLEAWALTYKKAQRAPYGIPAGEIPITLYFVGAKATCDAEEVRLAALKGTGVGMKAISEPCHGPFYFQRDR